MNPLLVNPHLAQLQTYPFDKLRTLLAGVTPNPALRPIDASWLNQVEVWFSILSRAALRASSFTSIEELCARIDSFIAAYNRFSKPFRWKAKEVHPSAPKRMIAQLRK